MSLWDRTVGRNYPHLRAIPGPAPRFPLGNLRSLGGRSPAEMTVELAAAYGPYALVWLANQPVVLVHDPAAILEILTTHASGFYKDEPLAAMQPALTAVNTFTSNGAEWHRVRARSFLSDDRYPAWLAAQFRPSLEFLDGRLARDLPILGGVELEKWLYRLVFDFTCQMVFGRPLGDDAFAAYNGVMDAADRRMSTNLPILPLGFARTKQRWVDAITQATAEARADGDGVSMAHYVARRSPLPIDAQAGTLGNMLPGGVFSVSAVFTELLGQLSSHPEYTTSLRRSLEGEIAGYEALAANVTLERGLREIFRLTPPVAVFMRRVREEPIRVGRITLDPGVRVIIGIHPLHHDAERWSEPKAFRPSRFTDDTLAANPFGSDYLFPFGRGPRTCHGQEMALFQLRVMLLALFRDPRRHVQVLEPGGHRFYFGCAMPTKVHGTLR